MLRPMVLKDVASELEHESTVSRVTKVAYSCELLN